MADECHKQNKHCKKILLMGDSTSRALHYFSNLEDKKWAYKKSMRELLILLIESESQHIELQDKICC